MKYGWENWDVDQKEKGSSDTDMGIYITIQETTGTDLCISNNDYHGKQLHSTTNQLFKE